MTGLHIGPSDDDDKAKKQFRFCCALNPGLSEVGHVLPEYIEERTLPVIEVGYPPLEDLREILQINVGCSQKFLEEFEAWYKDHANMEISVRKALALATFALRFQKPLQELVPHFL
jgi:hypothetical protein